MKETTESIQEITKNETWDLLKYILTGVVSGLSLVMVYFFNQIQMIREKVSDNATAIALNDQHDVNTDETMQELKQLIREVNSKLDQLLMQKK